MKQGNRQQNFTLPTDANKVCLENLVPEPKVIEDGNTTDGAHNHNKNTERFTSVSQGYNNGCKASIKLKEQLAYEMLGREFDLKL